MSRKVQGDDGAYAILYGLLVLVALGMASIVVDLGLLRADKRESRSAADSASLAGAPELGRGPWNPLAACQVAWDYALDNLALGSAGSPCGGAVPAPGFVNAVTACPSGSRTATGTVSGVTIMITWPVPFISPLMQYPDGKPGTAARLPDPSDGSSGGCDRLGVALQRGRTLGLAGALGTGTGGSYAASVARFDPDGGPADEVAALNVLNRQDCESLVTTGGGKIVIAPTVRGSTVIGPGIIGVESSGKGSCGGSATGPGGERVINPTTGSGSLICASLVQLNLSGSNCDGLGVIRSHALDPDQNATRAFSEAAVTGGNLKPQPTSEGGRRGWDPVTKKYGCEVIGASLVAGGCVVAGDNYIAQLVAALGGTGAPIANYVAETPYSQPHPGAFTLAPTACPGGAGITTTVTLAAGNHYANCTIDINGGGALIVQGGTLVVQGGIKVASGGCLVVNHTICTPALTGPGTSAVSTLPAPTKDALVFLRGTTGCPSSGCFSMSGTLVMPKTFVYSMASAEGMNVGSSSFTLWTAPGAGAVDAAGRTQLETDCLVTTATGTAPSQDCLNARFSRLTYWSEFPSPKTKANNFGGQGALNVVGVFFTPRAYFNFTGGGTYTAASAQFWADSLNVNGLAFVGLRPDARFSIATPTSRVQLVR